MSFVNLGSRALQIGGTEVISSARAVSNVTTGAFSGNVTVGGTITVTGAATLNGITTIQGDNDYLQVKSADFTNVYLGNASTSGAGLDRGVLALYDAGVQQVLIQAGAATLIGATAAGNAATTGIRVAGTSQFDANIFAAGLPTVAGAAGSLWVDASGFVKRA